MKDLHTRRVYLFYDFTKAQMITPDQFWCVSGKVNSADKPWLVIESVKTDAKNSECGTDDGNCWNVSENCDIRASFSVFCGSVKVICSIQIACPGPTPLHRSPDGFHC